MIWQETDHVAVIVMLTQLAEGPREKCFQYYPDDSGSDEVEFTLHNDAGEETAGSVKVVDTSYDEASKTTIRKIVLTWGDQTKTVSHLFFLAWPDFGVPEEEEDRVALFELISLARSKNASWDNPAIVHCSAGVGRSGTFIALEHLLQELASGHLDTVDDSQDPIFDTVSKLREQRMTMVQSDVQYQFLYTMLTDAYRKRLDERERAERGDTKIHPPDGPATEMVPASGEPSPKAIRLSRTLNLKSVLSNIRDRSRSRRRGDKDETKTPTTAEGKTP